MSSMKYLKKSLTIGLNLKIKEIENYIEESIASSKTLKDVSIHFKEEISSIDLQQNNNDYPSIFKNKVFDSNLDEIYFSTSDNDVFIAKTNNVTFPEDDAKIIKA